MAKPSTITWSADDRELMRADKVLRRVMEEQGPIHPDIDRRGSRPDPWEALARAIVGQQLDLLRGRADVPILASCACRLEVAEPCH